MSIILGIPTESIDGENRVAASPDTVKKLTAMGVSVQIASGAGQKASIPDTEFKDAGAKISQSNDNAIKTADIVLGVQANADHLNLMKKGAIYIAMMAPYNNEDFIKDAAKANVVAMSMEMIPRISRAQAMDVLSSQSNLAGYKAVLDATEHYARAFPMMMTAAGTVAPAKVFVMGAGVAGLQAIATARRLGAVVSATDVRPAAKEQVKSLGANFVAVEDDEFKEAETAGGYAKQMSADYQKKQSALVEEHIAKQDIVITTALIPGRPAPKLITAKMVASMKPGSVVVDMAVEAGGNCELSEAGKVVTKNNVTLVGHANIASRIAASASALYAKNLFNFLSLFIKEEAIQIDWDDEIIQGVTLTKDGGIIHPNFAPKKSETKSTAKTDEKADDKKAAGKDDNTNDTEKKDSE